MTDFVIAFLPFVFLSSMGEREGEGEKEEMEKEEWDERAV